LAIELALAALKADNKTHEVLSIAWCPHEGACVAELIALNNLRVFVFLRTERPRIGKVPVFAP